MRSSGLRIAIIYQILFSVLISILLVFAIGIKWNHFSVELVYQQEQVSLGHLVSGDFDGDGWGDFAWCNRYNSRLKEKCNCCVVYGIKNGVNYIINQVNYEALPDAEGHSFALDLDKDGVDELYTLSVKGNIAIINRNYGNLLQEQQSLALDTFERVKGNVDLRLRFLNKAYNSAEEEMIISLINSYPVFPRRLYRLNWTDKTVFKGPSTAIGFDGGFISRHKNLITGSHKVSGNKKEHMDIPYTDHRGYAVVIDDQLKPLFKPIPLSYYPGFIANAFVEDKLISIYRSDKEDSRIRLEARSFPGTAITDTVSFIGVNKWIWVKEGFTNLLYLCVDQNIFRLNSRLQIEDMWQIKGPKIGANNVIFKDIDSNARPELIYQNTTDDRYYILDDQYKESHELQGLEGEVAIRLHIRKTPEGHQFFVKTNNKTSVYAWSENPFYFLRFPYYAGLFSLIFLSIRLTLARYLTKVEKLLIRQRDYRKLLALNLKNQLDPYFTLNALEDIKQMYENNKGDLASLYTTRLSRMVHQTVVQGDSFVISLYEELDFCRNYMNLEKLRNSQFNYEISVGEELDLFEIKFPKQLLFIFVRKAIENQRESKGSQSILKLSLQPEKGKVLILLQGDDTISALSGEDQAISKETIKLFRQIEGIKIRYEISKERVMLWLHT